MKHWGLTVLLSSVTLLLIIEGVRGNDESCHSPPYVIQHSSHSNGNGNGHSGHSNDDHVHVKPVYGCCSVNDNNDNETPLLLQRVKIGEMVDMSEEQAMNVLHEASAAWDRGAGVWPTMSLKQRIQALEHFINEFQKVRDEALSVLMYEIGKNKVDAEAEFDRTITFIQQIIEVVKEDLEFRGKSLVIGSTNAFLKRGPIGLISVLGPFNYPLNETYAMAIPALLMGNIVVMKIPSVGGLIHLLSMKAFARALPPNTITFISGSARKIMPTIMKSGLIDGLAFIGGSNAADYLIKDHPEPHRLKVFLQLEAKNMAIFLEDIFESENNTLLDKMVNEAVSGALSYNGQRCTALKIFFVPKKYSDHFVKLVSERVSTLSVGLPWETIPQWNTATGGSSKYPNITPLPNSGRIKYMKELIEDAVALGARVTNLSGGEVKGGDDSTLMIPAVLYPVSEGMKIFKEEQFGPIVPIVPYDNNESILSYAKNGKYAQQCSIFTAQGEEDDLSRTVNVFSNIFGKININSQCGRSPDVLPFSGRRSSALGVMSVSEALKEFSVPVVISYKSPSAQKVVTSLQDSVPFMEDL